MIYLQDFFFRYYDIRPTHSVYLNKVIGNSTKILGVIANILLPLFFKVQKLYKRIELSGKSDLIICFTSFPTRINNVWLVIECLLRQTILPDRIILYLSQEQFPSMKEIPKQLKKYHPQILDIKIVDGDIKSHKKYWYAISDFPNSDIITVDDDLIYDSRLIEELYKAHKDDPLSIPCCWGSKMKWTKDGIILPYSRWGGERTIGEIREDIFFGSGGGTYFPAGSLRGANQPIEDIMKVCPLADDVWLNAVCRKNGYYAKLIRNCISIPEWKINNNRKLATLNNGEKRNDHQLIAVAQYMIEKFSFNPFCKKG